MATGRSAGPSWRALVDRTVDNAAGWWSSKRPAAFGGAATAGGRERARPSDVSACYRLLLGRAPDADGLHHYLGRLRSEQLTVATVVSEFLGSVEFARAHPAGPGPGTGAAVEVVTTCEGYRMHVDPTDFAVGHTLARTGSYEPEVSAVVRSLLSKGSTFIDVGANIGWFSMLGASVVGASGRVLAIEPNPNNVNLLEKSAKDNGYAQIEVMTVALTAEPTALALETDGSNGRMIPIDGPPPQPVKASFVVPGYPLDSLLALVGITHVDVMKIDVEGAEPLVLQGARDLISDSRPVIITEFFPLALDCAPWGSAEGYLAMLRDMGYNLSVIGEEGDHDDQTILAMAGRPGHDHVDLLARSH